MDPAIEHVITLKLPHITSTLLSHGQYDRGRKPALQDRLIGGLRKDYAEGWTHGHMLNTRIIPFKGQGRDPQELIGLHLKSFQLIRGLGSTLEFTDGEDQIIIMRPSRPVATAVCVEFERYGTTSALYFSGSEDGMRWGKWEIDRAGMIEKPAPIVEAVTGIRRNLEDESTSLVLGLRCEGMSKM